MGARTDAARAEVLAARAGLDEELVRLEASGRAAVDIPARLRREPAKVLGRRRRCRVPAARRARSACSRASAEPIFGPDADLPKSMLPPEVEKTLKKLGPDGEKVRGHAGARVRRLPRREGAAAARSATSAPRPRCSLGGALKPVVTRLGKQLAERALDPDGSSFAEGMRRARERAERRRRRPTATAGTPRCRSRAANRPVGNIGRP